MKNKTYTITDLNKIDWNELSTLYKASCYCTTISIDMETYTECCEEMSKYLLQDGYVQLDNNVTIRKITGLERSSTHEVYDVPFGGGIEI